MRCVAKPKVLVLGGGFGGLEATLYTRMRLPDAEISVISDKDYFLFKPNMVYVPFGLDPGKLTLRLAWPTRRKQVRFINAKAREVDAVSKRVTLESMMGSGDDTKCVAHSYTDSRSFNLPYDFLVIATGASMRPAE